MVTVHPTARAESSAKRSEKARNMSPWRCALMNCGARSKKQPATELLTITGGLTLESQNSEAVMHGRRDFLHQAIRCAEKFHIRHEILETADIRKRYPQFAVTDERAYFEYETGFLRPELCIEAQLHLARSTARPFKPTRPLSQWKHAADAGVTVKTAAEPTPPRRSSSPPDPG